VLPLCSGCCVTYLSGLYPPYRMGVGTASYMQRAYADRESRNETPLSETLHFLDHCHKLGAAGIQAGLSSIEGGYPGKVRSRAAKYGMYVEVTARLPKDDSDLALFQKTVRAAANAGATVIRSVNLLGRRYAKLEVARARRADPPQAQDQASA